jgi:hypothetical protein
MQESNLFSIPLTVQVDESSTDFTQWTVNNFVYCNQVCTLQTPSRRESATAAKSRLRSCNSLLSVGWNAYASGLLLRRVLLIQRPRS